MAECDVATCELRAGEVDLAPEDTGSEKSPRSKRTPLKSELLACQEGPVSSSGCAVMTRTTVWRTSRSGGKRRHHPPEQIIRKVANGKGCWPKAKK